MGKNYFIELNEINVSGKTEKKNGLTYLSWAWAWSELKKLHPDASYTIYENADGWCYHTDGRTAWVKTGVIVNGIEHIEYLPIMDYKNRSIPLDKITSFDVNKAIQRSLTKACARHGLGLYVYAGEDLPEESSEQKEKPVDIPASPVDIPASPVITDTQIKFIDAEMKALGLSERQILAQIKEGYNVQMASIAEITQEQYAYLKTQFDEFREKRRGHEQSNPNGQTN